MSTRALVGISLFCVAISALVLANLFLTKMIREVNRNRQESDLISYFGFTFPKILRIFHEYRQLYSTGKLHMYALISFGIAMAGLFIVAVCLHII